MRSESDIYSNMKENEMLELIDFSPNNLKDFFDSSIIVNESNDSIPGYGSIRNGNI